MAGDGPNKPHCSAARLQGCEPGAGDGLVASRAATAAPYATPVAPPSNTEPEPGEHAPAVTGGRPFTLLLATQGREAVSGGLGCGLP